MNIKLTKWTIHIIAVVLAMIWWLPVVWTIIVSIKPAGSNVVDITQWLIPPFTWENFNYVFNNPQADIFRWMINSFVVSTISTALVVILSLLAAYAFSRFKFPGRYMWFWVIMAGLMVPGESLLIPTFIFFKDLGLINTYTSLILPAIESSFGVILLKQFIDGLPSDLFDAAKIDGCTSFGILANVVVPLTKGVIASLIIFTFLGRWNDFLWPFISITDSDIMTLPVGIVFFKSQSISEMAYPMTVSVVASLPVLLIFFIFQKAIAKGIAFTGIKG